MTKHDTKHAEEEMIITLPVSGLDALGIAMPGDTKGVQDASRGNMSMTAAPVGRDRPFPCYKKTMWDDQVVVKVVQVQPGQP